MWSGQEYVRGVQKSRALVRGYLKFVFGEYRRFACVSVRDPINGRISRNARTRRLQDQRFALSAAALRQKNAAPHVSVILFIRSKENTTEQGNHCCQPCMEIRSESAKLD
jgi:hypothetical protein